MVGFEERWDAIIALLRTEADRIVVPPENIIKLDLGQQPNTTTPFVWVAMIPGDWVAGIDAKPIANRATVECFCGVGMQGAGRSSVAAATALAVRVIHLLQEHGHVAKLSAQPIVPDTVTTLYTATNLQFSTEVDYAEGA